ncbi:hypothetical protein [Agrobacterium sp. NPDC090273]|uniref:hypothetical protein n=1 Tax=Agrobacterium sp. NPDC090273 TaxID=3363919 RepID=UPI00383B9FC8
MPIASSFSAARDAVVSGVDQRYAERIRLSPMNNGKADPDRPQLVIMAVLRTGDETASPLDVNGGRSLHSRIAAGKAALHIDRTEHPAIVLRKQDSVRALDRPGEPLFQVSTVDDRNHIRLIIGLNQAS